MTSWTYLTIGQFCFLGLHNGIGPPSLTVTIGAATATYVHTNPTIRNNILTARFIGCFSLRAGPLGAETLTARNYTVQLKKCTYFYAELKKDKSFRDEMKLKRAFLQSFQQHGICSNFRPRN